jgi:hypothetical protein
VALAVRLSNGRLIEAFIEMQRHVSRVTGAAQQAEHAERLVGELLQRAQASLELHKAVCLPLCGAAEESAAVGWLRGSAVERRDPAAAAMLVLFYFLRGRLPEALAAHSEFRDGALAEASGRLSLHVAHLEELLSAAARALPAVQREAAVARESDLALLASLPELAGRRDAEAAAAAAAAGTPQGAAADEAMQRRPHVSVLFNQVGPATSPSEALVSVDSGRLGGSGLVGRRLVSGGQHEVDWLLGIQGGRGRGQGQGLKRPGPWGDDMVA